MLLYYILLLLLVFVLLLLLLCLLLFLIVVMIIVISIVIIVIITAQGTLVEGSGTDGGLTTDHKPDHPSERARYNLSLYEHVI